MKGKVTPFAENIAESTGACLVAMVQGNLLALTLSHLFIAAQTGIIAGVIASAIFLIVRSGKRWIIAVLLGVATAIVDYFVHPGMFGPAAMEAFVTGLAAGLLSYVIGGGVEAVIAKVSARKASAADSEVVE